MTESSSCPLVAALNLQDDTVVDIVTEVIGEVHQDAENENLKSGTLILFISDISCLAKKLLWLA